MARPGYRSTVLVLAKTKLGESDLIVSALKEDGSLLRGVAKGARKPANPLSARLDVFCVSDCMIVPGRNLHIFSEARCKEAHLTLRNRFESNAAASPVVEALLKTAQESLEIPRLFDMSTAALDAIEDASGNVQALLTAAFLLKLSAMLGFRPNFSECACCGTPVGECGQAAATAFSYLDGGVLCGACAQEGEGGNFDGGLAAWCNALMMGTFSEIASLRTSCGAAVPVLGFCRNWLEATLSVRLKSLPILLSCIERPPAPQTRR